MSDVVDFKQCPQCDAFTNWRRKGINIALQLADGTYLGGCHKCGTILRSVEKYPVEMVKFNNYKRDKAMIDDLLYPGMRIALEKERKARIVNNLAAYADQLDW